MFRPALGHQQTYNNVMASCTIIIAIVWVVILQLAITRLHRLII